ncbi:hypothetical protein ABZ802_31545 [Streptomyces sp. NPDC047737]|uniref:hypothetical protein n=1 Tax=Streptomyces sp. NPDC047737 TaxID=3155740 RepID=UPI003401FB37
MTTTPATPPPFRYVDEDGFCLSARLLPDLNTGRATSTLSITIEGSDEPQSVHVPVDQLPQILAGLADAAALAVARQVLGTTGQPETEAQPDRRREAFAKAMALRDGHPEWPVQYEDDERAYLRRADAVLAVLPAPADRAVILREAADFVRGLLVTRPGITTAGLEAELRVWADEAQQPTDGNPFSYEERERTGRNGGLTVEQPAPVVTEEAAPWVPKRVSLGTPCATCRHARNWHTGDDGACTVGECECTRFATPAP